MPIGMLLFVPVLEEWKLLKLNVILQKPSEQREQRSLNVYTRNPLLIVHNVFTLKGKKPYCFAV